jgi:hypothetical protein
MREETHESELILFKNIEAVESIFLAERMSILF